VALTITLGWLLAMTLPPLLGVPARWGAAGLTVSAGIAGCVEFGLLRSRLARRVGPTPLPWGLMARLWGSALVGAAVAWSAKLAIAPAHPWVVGPLVLLPYGATYVSLVLALGVPEARRAVAAVAGRWLSRSTRPR